MLPCTLIEELSLSHWPSLSTQLYDGWILRFADGYTKRSNSVSPLYGGYCTSSQHTPLSQKITYCEHIYTRRRLPTIFKITSSPVHQELDEQLEARNYVKCDVTRVQTLELHRLNKPDILTVVKRPYVTSEWLEIFCRLHQNGYDEDQIETMRMILNHILSQSCFMTLCVAGEEVACGLGVISRGYIGLYDIVTGAEYRNKGYGEQLVLNLLHWGRENGAERSYLAVVAGNKPAVSLYSKMGFQDEYSYWYRIKEMK